MTTYSDLLDALNAHKTIESNRWLLASSTGNVRNDIAIDKETGEITFSQSGLTTKNIPSDITAIQKNSGSATYQARQFIRLFDDMNSWITSGFTIGTIQNLARSFLNPDDAGALDIAVSAYVTANPQHAPTLATLQESIYDAGNLASGVFNDAVNQAEALLNDMLTFVGHAGNVSGQWFDFGQSTPNSDYLAYDSTLRDSVTVTIDGVTTSTQSKNMAGWTFSNPRRVRLTLSGVITKTSDGNYMDGRDQYTSNGTFVSLGYWEFKVGGNHIIAPDSVVFDSSGNAQYIIDVPNGDNTFKYRHKVSWAGDETGQITVVIDDLGVA